MKQRKNKSSHSQSMLMLESSRVRQQNACKKPKAARGKTKTVFNLVYLVVVRFTTLQLVSKIQKMEKKN